MGQNYKISDLTIGNCELGDEGATLLSKGIIISQSIVHLQLPSNQITYLGGNSIFKAMQLNKSITCLDLSSPKRLNSNRVGPGSMEELKKVLQKSRIITFLNLSSNSIGDFGLGYLVEGMVSGTGSVISLSMASNSFSRNSLDLVLKLIQESANLLELDLSCNSFGNELCLCLSQAFQNPVHLQRLFIKSCQITRIFLYHF